MRITHQTIIYCLIILYSALLPNMGFCGTSDKPLVRAGGLEMNTVYVPPSSSRTMDFAAHELSRYLSLMTSREVQVTTERRSDAAGVHLDVDSSLKHDGYTIQISGAWARVSGGSPRGTLYGVYAFLHELGCRWPLPGKQYEVAPRLSRIELSDQTIRRKPAIDRRGMLMASGPEEALIDYVDFLAKNGFNFVFLYLTSNLSDDLRIRLSSAMADRDMGLDYGGHWLPGLLPRDLFKDHPEYFRMENGKRTNDLNMCASNPEAIEIMARNAQPHIDYMKGFSRPETLHLWADDIFTGGWCSCEKCKDLSGSDQLLQVLDNLSDKLSFDGGIRIADIAYHGSIYAPSKTTAGKRVRMMYAARERCYRHPLDGCPTNRRYLEYLKDDLKVLPDGAEVFDYLQDLILFRFMAVPLHPVIGKDIKIYKKLGVNGVFAHAFETYSDWAYGPNAYVLSKALWRGDGDDKDMNEYCEALYGPAAQSARRYFDKLYSVVSTAMETCGYPDFTDMRFPPTHEFNKQQVDQLAPLMTDYHLDSIEADLREALNVGKEPYRSRVEDQMLIWKYTRGELNAIYHILQANVLEAEIQKAHADPAKAPAQVKDDMILRYQAIVDELESGTRIVTAAPERLRGWFGTPESGSVAERGKFGYVGVMRGRLDQWRAAKPGE